MSHQPFAHAGSLRIGTVDFVSPDEVKVLLDIEAPETVALNAGGVRPFPRVNGYVLLPVDDAFLVAQIEWLTIERSKFPTRQGVKDFGLIDLPYPLRKMSLAPLGTLRKKTVVREGNTAEEYEFRRGADALPSLGSPVFLPLEKQLRAIVESGEKKRVKIGNSPLAGNAEVKVDPDRLFGRHLAILGNTGSGKSCSVAGLIRWSLEQAQIGVKDVPGQTQRPPNARFVILDPNGEYTKAFDAGIPGGNVRVFKVKPETGDLPLKVPLWFWNSAEWASFTQASAKTQRPTLIQALRCVRDGQTEPVENSSHEIRRFLRTLVTTIRLERNSGSPWDKFPKPKSFFEKLEKWKASLVYFSHGFSDRPNVKLEELISEIEKLCEPRRKQHANMDFTFPEVDSLLQIASQAHSAFGGTDADAIPPDVDVPLPFDVDSLVRSVEASAEMLNVSEHVETLLIRIRALLNDTRMKPVIESEDEITLAGWLEEYIGKDGAANGCVSVIDLSLVPTEVIHVLTAVIARMIFEAQQRYLKLEHQSLPTVLVMEEAHTFVKRYREDSENHDAASICCQVFERIAREGRKFGLGLVLSSQRPSELSPTVLSQCNTFLLHRISNDKDQELVHRLVPDNLRGLLRELPSLPSQHAILLGWASELPILVKMNDLPVEHRPRSEDPHFWEVWTGGEPRPIHWQDLADDWQEKRPADAPATL